MKKCTTCKIPKPETEEYFYFNNQTQKFKNPCKICVIEYTKEYNSKLENKKRQKEHNLKNNKKDYQNNRKNILKQKQEYYKKIERPRRIKIGKITGTSQSKEEGIIEDWLKERNIKFETEKYLNCINPKTNCNLPFDFYLKALNIIIEFDGIHHFQPIWGKEKLEGQQYRDQIKTKYCQQKEINLIRVSYQQNIKKELCDLIL